MAPSDDPIHPRTHTSEQSEEQDGSPDERYGISVDILICTLWKVSARRSSGKTQSSYIWSGFTEPSNLVRNERRVTSAASREAAPRVAGSSQLAYGTSSALLAAFVVRLAVVVSRVAGWAGRCHGTRGPGSRRSA